MHSKNTFLILSFCSVFIIVLIAFGANQQITVNYTGELESNLSNNITEVDNFLLDKIDSYKRDVSFLHSTPPISGLTRAKADGVDPLDGTTTELWLKRLSQIFAGFMQYKIEYSQLRVLDAQGQEILRVEKQNNQVSVVPENDLQNERDNPNFLAASKLHKGQMYLSLITLNTEYDQITLPYTPTLRIAKPIYSSENEFFGIIILNVDISPLLKGIRQLVADKYKVFMTDADGYFINHPDKSLQYSRDLSSNHRLSSVYQRSQAYNISIFEDGNKKFWGIESSVKVAQNQKGGEIINYIMLPDQTYKEELNSRKFESMLAVVITTLIGAFAISFLHRNNKKLTDLLEVAEESQSAIDVAEDAVITLSNDLKINIVNRAFERLFLVHESEYSKKNALSFFTELGDSQFEQAIDAVKSSHPATSYEWKYKYEHKSFWLNTKITHITNSNSSAAFAIVIRDITLEKESAKQIENTNKILEKTVEDRTKELKIARDKALEVSNLKSKFISTISHEMRTPLNGIVGATELLKKEQLNDKQARFVTMAENSALVLKNLVNDVLDLSKIEAGKLELNFQDFNPEQLIESVVGTMSVLAKQKGLNVYLDTVDLDLLTISSDPFRLTQILNNLLNNAVKFTQEGFIKVRVWSDIQNDMANFCVEVQDTGIGISPQSMNKMFTEFSQANQTIATNYGGTGLGLSICRNIIKLLGGDISVASIESEGSKFTFYVPIEDWSAKPRNEQLRLQHTITGVMVKQPELLKLLTKLIKSNAGDIVHIKSNHDFSAVDKVKLLIVEASHEQFQEFCDHWNHNFQTSTEQIKLIVIANSSVSNKDLPRNATLLISPIFRSTFLSAALNSRKENSTNNATVERRSVQNHKNSKVEDELKNKECSILVVDDNLVNCEVTKFLLDPLSKKVVTVENGSQAIDYLASEDSKIDIILMDCNMPVMDGYETSSAIRKGMAGEKYLSVPIIAMTANAMQGSREKCEQAGMTEFISKPIDAQLLFDIILAQLNNQKSKSKAVEITNEQLIWDKKLALTRLGNREQLLQDLIKLFIQETKDKLHNLQQGLIDHDRAKIRLSAHTFKGVCGDVGAARLQAILQQIEQSAETEEFDRLSENFQMVEEQLQITLDTFKEYINAVSY
ncbi:ATP-binding protein [Glaciecola sp. 1036]|uniref:ATP-binding protein n=1 Tax=Alteromonadaceae TaxID=72275 RepID=UPI003D045926